MTTTEIKKALYKQKPMATFRGQDENRGDMIYTCDISELKGTSEQVCFTVPESESEPLKEKEQAQLLIRWLTGTITLF